MIKNKKQHTVSLVEDLEHRIMFSADILGMPLIDVSYSEIAQSDGDNTLPLPQAATVDELASTVVSHSAEIVFVDASTPEKENIIADLVAQQNAGRSLLVVMIDSDEDGIGTITDTLSSHSNVSAVHVISHGNDSGMVLGNSWFDQQAAENNSDQLSQWQNSLTSDADLLLYGCNLASSAQGSQLLNTISIQTGADVAASDNTTGHAFFQGDWNLEYSTGSIEAEIALSQTLQEIWTNKLAIDLLAVDDDFGELVSGSSIDINDATGAPATDITVNDQSSAPSIQLISVADPAVGTITNNNGDFTYTAPPGFIGDDSFNYIITDSNQPILNHYPLDSNIITDSTGRGESVAVAPENQPTLNANELEFDGNDYIEIPDIDYTSEFTLSIDFKIGDINYGNTETLFQHGEHLSNNSIQIYIVDEFLVVSVTDSSGDAPDFAPPSFDITAFSNTSSWQNLIITHSEYPASGPTGETEIHVYINGVDQNVYNNFQRGGDPIDPPGNIFIGQYVNSDGSSQDYLENHQVREFRLYNENISPHAANQTIDYSKGTVSLSLDELNLAPVFTALNANPAYVEGQLPIVIDDDVTISDSILSADDNFNGSTFTLQRASGANAEDTFSHSGNLDPLLEGQLITYNDPTTGLHTVGSVTNNSNGLLQLSFNNNATNDLVNSVLQSISYTNTSGTPPATVDVSWQFTDGFAGPAEFGTSLTATGFTTVNIEQRPDFTIAAPAIQINTDEDTSYVFANNIDITHDQNASDSFSTVLTVNDGVLSTIPAAAITMSGDNTNRLSISGPVGALNQTLQSIIYTPSTNFHGADNLLIEGSFDSHPTINTSVTTNILVNSMTDMPVIGNAGNTVIYDAITSTAVAIDTDITISDLELNSGGNFNNTSLSLVRISASGTATGPLDSANPEDTFTAPTQAFDLLEGSDLIDGGIFGLVQKNSGGELQLVFNASADTAKIETLMQSISYESNSAWPPTSTSWPSNKVELQWTFNDNGNDEFGATGVLVPQSGIANSTIDITAPGQPPQAVVHENLLINTGSTGQFLDSSLLTYVDPDSAPAEIVYTITGISNNTGTLERNGVVLNINDTFSQKDINQRILTYTSTTSSPNTTLISYDVAGANSISTSGIIHITTFNDGPSALQTGIRLNMDGGNDAFLGGTGDAEFIRAWNGLTKEFTFSELSFGAGNTEATLYSTSGGTKWPGTTGYLTVKSNGAIHWQPPLIGPNTLLTAYAPGILDGGMHTIAVTIDSAVGGRMQLFYDGALKSSAPTNLGQQATYIGGFPWVVGQRLLSSSILSSPTSFDNYDFVPGSHFSGIMHEARYWNEVRTDGEISSNKTARLDYDPILTPELTAVWHMHDPNGDETVVSVDNLGPGRPLQPTISTLAVGHVTEPGFTPSTPTDEFVVDETATNGTVVGGYLTPLDPFPDLAGYKYSLVPNGQPTAFAINADTGEISVTDSSLLPKANANVDLVVRVKSTDATGVTHNENIRLNVYTINEPPSISLSGTTPVSYTEGDPPVSVDAGTAVSDSGLEATSFGGSTLTLERFDNLNNVANANPNDAFSSDLFGAPSTLFSTAQNNGQLVITFNSGATKNDVDSILQSIKYENTSDDPLTDVTLRWLFNDGNLNVQGSGGALTANAYTDIQIIPVNDSPVINSFPGSFKNTDEDTWVEISFSELFTEASDIDGTVMAFEVVSTGSGSLTIGNSYGTASTTSTLVTSSDSVFWTPPADATGIHPAFEVVAVDDQNAYSISPRQINIDVNSLSDYPEGSDNVLYIVEDSTRTLTPGDFGFTDVDGDSLVSVDINSVSGGSVWLSGTELSAPTQINISDLSLGKVSYQPSPNLHTHTAEINFNVNDSGSNNTSLLSNVLSFEVASVNDAPTAQNKTIPVREDVAVSLLAADFSFLDSADVHSTKTTGDSPYSVIIDSIPSHGLLISNGIPLRAGDEVLYSSLTSSLTFEPGENNATDTWFDFRVKDNGGVINGQDVSSSANRIDLPVTSVNDQPSGTDFFIDVTEGARHTFSASEFGFTDTADSNNFLAVVLQTLPLDGYFSLSNQEILTTPATISILDIDNGYLTYTPPTNTQDNIDTTFTFLVQDDGDTINGGVDTASDFNIATITNQGVNDPPVVQGNNSIVVLEDTPYLFNSSDFGFTDTENHALLAVDITSMPNGKLTLNNITLTSPTRVQASDIDNSKLSYTPNLNQTGTPADSFQFRIQDDGGLLNGGDDTALVSQPLSINIDNISDQPTANNFNIDVLEETVHSFSLTEFGFLDVADGDAFNALHLTTLPTVGSLTLSDAVLEAPAVIDPADIQNGLFKYLPPANTENAPDTSFQFKVQDSGSAGLNTSAQLYIATINNIDVNDPPVTSNNASINILEDERHVFQVTDFGYTDTENHQLINIIIDSVPVLGSLSLDGANNIVAGSVVSTADIGNGLLVYTPAVDSNGTDSFLFRVQDNGGTQSGGLDTALTSQPFTVSISPVNDPPVASDFTLSVLEDSVHTFNASQFGFSDPSDDHAFEALHIQSLPTDGNLTLNSVPITQTTIVNKLDLDSGLLKYVPPENTQGNVNTAFTFTVQDSGGTTNGGLDTDPGLYNVTIANIGINDPPVTAIGDGINILEDTNHVFQVADFGYSDQEDHPLISIIIDSVPVLGSLSLGEVNITTGSVVSTTDIDGGFLVYTPLVDSHGTDSFLYRVQDNGGIQSGGLDTALTSQPFTVNISPVNDHPVASDFTLSVLEDSTHTFNASQFGFSDPSDDHAFEALHIQSLPSDGNLTLNSVPIIQTTIVNKLDLDSGLLKYVPPENTQGNVNTTFSFTVQDSGGTTNGGLDTDPGFYNVTITNIGINDPPVLPANSSVTIFEDTLYTFKVDDFEFFDAEDHQLQTLLIDSPPVFGSLFLYGSPLTSASSISIADISNSALTYRSAPDSNGLAADTLYYRVQDDGGLLNGGNNTSLSSEPLLIQLLNVNDPPTGSDSTINVLEDTPYTFQPASFFFVDIDADNLQEILIDATTAGRLEVNGSVVDIGSTVSTNDIIDGNFHYIPPANINGSSADSLRFFLRDTGGSENGGIDTSVISYSINIDITSINDPPQGNDSIVTTLEDTPVSIGREHFSFTDTDNDEIRAVKISGLPLTGQLNLNGTPVSANSTISISDIDAGNLIFNPIPDTHGINYAQIEFQLIDDGVSTGVDTDETPNVMSINVVSVSDAPVPLDNIIQLSEDSEHQFTRNDFQFTDSADSPYENSLSAIELIALPARGSLTLNDQPILNLITIPVAEIDAGNLRFVPTTDAWGEQYATLIFNVIDNGSNEQNGATTSTQSAQTLFEVAPVNDTPVATRDTFTTTESYLFDSDESNFSLTDNDTDTDTDATLTVSLLIPPEHGELELNADGSFLYAHDGGESTEDQFTYQLSDGFQTDEATVTVSILPLNDAPSAGAAGAYTVIENQSFQLQLPQPLFNDPDLNDSLQITISSANGNDSLEWISLDPDTMLISGIPTQAGDFAFRLIASDTQNATAETILYLTVTGEPVVPEEPQIAAAQEPTADEPYSLPEPPKISIGTASSIANIESTSFASANQASTRSAPEITDSPQDIHAQILIPDTIVRENISVFTPNPVKLAPNDLLLNQLQVIQLDPVKTSIPLGELFDANENKFTAIGNLASQLDNNRESMSSGTESNLKILGGAISISSGLSIGYVVWLLRGGLLISSVLTSLPAWRWLDPLPVLSTLEGAQDDTDDESLEDLVNHDQDTDREIDDQKPGNLVDADIRKKL